MPGPVKPIRKLLVANRSEIAIRVFRTAHELGIRTVAIYSHEDRYALHRFKADEAYQVGKPGEPIRAYLDIDGIIALAKQHGVDAIHPGYGFLSENPELAAGLRARRASPSSARGRRCWSSWATRSPPAASPSRPACRSCGGSDAGRRTPDEAQRAGRASSAIPVILKAAKGGGGRGMRVVQHAEQELAAALRAGAARSR